MVTASLCIAVLLLALLVLAARADASTWRVPSPLIAAGLLAVFASRLLLQGRVVLSDTIEGGLLASGAVHSGWPIVRAGVGDMKPAAVVGAKVGLYLGAMAVVFTLIAGGAIALAVALRGVSRQSVADDAGTDTRVLARTSGAAPAIPSTGIRFPFALMILAGVTFALWARL